MDHAIGAFFVIADAIFVPIGRIHQLAESFGVSFAEQVAGPLPAKHRARRIAPGGAMIGLVAGEKIEKQRRLIEAPGLAALALGGVALGEDVAKELLGAGAVEEVLLVGRALIGVAGRDGDALDA